MDAYPHELSGGMCQRVIIAMAVCGHPKLIIADEPTTALDVTVQAQVLELLKDLQKKLNTAILLITHNLGVVWEMCDTVMVMYAGKEMEYGDVRSIFKDPLHRKAPAPAPCIVCLLPDIWYRNGIPSASRTDPELIPEC